MVDVSKWFVFVAIEVFVSNERSSVFCDGVCEWRRGRVVCVCVCVCVCACLLTFALFFCDICSYSSICPKRECFQRTGHVSMVLR